ncbi:hypothetical protein JTB14_018969 [Gonioctena quinquepunctata]|nr:hypothetical protein JTB14_018969 [Gonioctena quinquepunctata]
MFSATIFAVISRRVSGVRGTGSLSKGPPARGPPAAREQHKRLACAIYEALSLTEEPNRSRGDVLRAVAALPAFFSQAVQEIRNLAELPSRSSSGEGYILNGHVPS